MNIELVTWNILADGYIRPKYYPNVDPAALKPAIRHPRVVEALVGFGADVMCLQEVEQPLFDAICAALEPRGYRCQLALKPGRAEGSALITRTSAVEVVTTHALTYEARSKGHASIALLAQLKLSSGAALVVVSTHLAWARRDTPPAEHPGCLQLAQLLDARDAGELMPAALSWIICGDLNDEPSGPVLKIAAARGCAMPCAQARPWHTGNFHERLVKLDYALSWGAGVAARPHALPALTATTPMPSAEHPSDHLPLRMSLTVG